MTGEATSIGYVNVLELKRFAAEKLSRQPALRYVLLTESDEIPILDLLARLPLWLTLLRRG